MNFTPEELTLLIDIVEQHKDKIEHRANYLTHAVTLEYYEKRIKRVKDLKRKLIQLRQELITFKFKIPKQYSIFTIYNKDTNGKVFDPDR